MAQRRDADGDVALLPAVPKGLLAEGFRRAVLSYLVQEQALSSRMLGWRQSGFSVHNQVRVVEQDGEGRKKLAGYMVRASMLGAP
jgi:hypothetical protein